MSNFSHSIKIVKIGNYIRCQDINVFFGYMSPGDLTKAIGNINTSSDRKIHLFVCNKEMLQSKVAKDTIQWFSNSHHLSNAKFLIHVPKSQKWLVDTIKTEYPVTSEAPFQIITEKNGTFFKIKDDASLIVDFTDGYMHAYIDGITLFYDNTPHVNSTSSNNSEDEPGKDEKVSMFKSTTPLAILKSFKDEDDIWNFINMNEDWGLSDKDINRINAKKNSTDVIKKIDITTDKKDPEEIKNEVKNIVFRAVKNLENNPLFGEKR